MNKEHAQGHRERLRQRFLNAGAEGMHDYEIIELLLTFVIPRRDVKPVAKDLLSYFGSISGIFDAPVRELSKIKGIGNNAAIMISSIKDICGAYLADRMLDTDVLSSPGDVRNFSRMKLSGLPEEAFMVIYLNIKNHVITHDILIRGTVDQAAVYPRKIVKHTLENDASGIILVHNHPSGICDPSCEDIRMTDAVKTALGTIDVKLLDHIIVGKSGYYSFLEHKLIGK
jgi:DNA repair protein RadC